VTSRRHNPILKGFADRLKEKGKAPKTILAAVARMLLVIAYDVLKTRNPSSPLARQHGISSAG
jgi:transposase